jgi:hypothetical protein
MFAHFRCPICRCHSYVPLEGLRLYACSGCTIVFMDPIAFTAFDPNGTAVGTGGMGGAHRR